MTRAATISLFAAILLLVAVLPISLRAQVTTPATVDDATAPAFASQSADDSGSPLVSSAISSDDVSAPSTGGQQPKSPADNSKPSKPKPSSDSDRPPIEGSMVGYIDNAVVGSEIRIRFDAGFGDNFPDRAEFFYAQCGCNAGAHGPKPGIATNLNFQQLYMRGEYAPTKRLSLLVDVPVRWIEPLQFAPSTVQSSPGFGDQSGLSDVQAGVKLALLASQQRYLTVQFVASFPSGDSYSGLGTGHYSVAPSLLYFQKVTDRFSLEAQLGDTHPIESSGQLAFAGDVFTYGIGPSYELYRGEKVRIASVLELVGWQVLGGLENNAALIGVVKPPVQSVDGVSIVNLKAGIRTSVGHHQSFYVGFGLSLIHI